MSTGVAGLEGILRDLSETAGDHERISVGGLLEAAGARGFGPILVLLAMLMILPIGVIPFMPAAVGALHVAIGVAMFVGYDRLHMPQRICRWTVSGDMVRGVLLRLSPWILRARKVLHQRARFMAEGVLAVRIIALVLILTGAAMVVIGFIPGLPFVLSIHILIIGFGLTANDGVVVGAGLICVAPEIYLGLRLLGWA